MTVPIVPIAPIDWMWSEAAASAPAGASDHRPSGGGHPCADAGRCDRAACGHAERAARACPTPEAPL